MQTLFCLHINAHFRLFSLIIMTFTGCPPSPRISTTILTPATFFLITFEENAWQSTFCDCNYVLAWKILRALLWGFTTICTKKLVMFFLYNNREAHCLIISLKCERKAFGRQLWRSRHKTKHLKAPAVTFTNRTVFQRPLAQQTQ